MKKIIFIAILSVAGFASAVAQPRAIGVNLGYGADISYQHSLGEANMIDVSLNIPAFLGIGATVTYDWINPFSIVIPWDYEGEWNWSLGVGGGAGTYAFLAYYVGAVGHVGISYDFWFPLQLSLDYRPNVGLAFAPADGGTGFNTLGLTTGLTLGVRYLF